MSAYKGELLQFQARPVTDDLLDNPVWHALAADHSRFAICASRACRYPSQVAPFAAVSKLSRSSLDELAELLEPAEQIYLLGDGLLTSEHFRVEEQTRALQMLRSRNMAEQPRQLPLGATLEILGRDDGPAMIDLTDLVFPGFFRPRTYEMGQYYGVRVDGELVAMAGERMALPNHREISGVCTHPAHAGRGFATVLIQKIMKLHDEQNLISFLHVGAANVRAIHLYERLGFAVRRSVTVRRLSRQTHSKAAAQFG
jgi:ribosomal protein S18 acetylase RimI-like enzyme